MHDPCVSACESFTVFINYTPSHVLFTEWGLHNRFSACNHITPQVLIFTTPPRPCSHIRSFLAKSGKYIVISLRCPEKKQTTFIQCALPIKLLLLISVDSGYRALIREKKWLNLSDLNFSFKDRKNLIFILAIPELMAVSNPTSDVAF